MYREQPTKENLREMAERNLDQFIHYVYRLNDSNNRLTDLVNQLADRIKYLEDQISKNSSNSSKPPSSDGFKRQNKTKSMRKKSGKKPGAQKGHKGSTLKRMDKPDEVVKHG